MLKQILEHHILSTLTFVLILLAGWYAYTQMPREQDPSVNFNWVQVWTFWPGASASDVEKRVTEPLEEGLQNLSDLKFVSSASREGVSSILVRFADLSPEEFDNRIADLHRELQAKQKELPASARQPEIFEVTSSNAFPTATVVVSGYADGESLQRAAIAIQQDFERLDEVDRVSISGGRDIELQVEFLPERLVGLGVSPVDLADSVAAYFRDLAAGQITVGEQNWLVRLQGTTTDPAFLERFPIVTAQGELPLRSIAEVGAGLENPQELVTYEGRPSLLLSVFKNEGASNLALLEAVKHYIAEKNAVAGSTGISITLIDDQTVATRQAIAVMERNALIGLALVFLAVGLFLGFKVAIVTTAGIPFVLAGTFLTLYLLGSSLNVTVLLAIVISLGMLVDDAVVVVEAIHVQLSKGVDRLDAARFALKEVMGPVTTAVLTTIAAFLPLMLLPGLLGDFMRVVPLVVTVALLFSLVEALWMLPSHLVALRPQLGETKRSLRRLVRRRLGRWYGLLLIRVLRRPKVSLVVGAAVLAFASGLVALGVVRVDFFAADVYRLFYVNVEMPPGTSLAKTSAKLAEVEEIVRQALQPGEVRALVSYAGQQVTETELLLGDERGQLFVSLRSSDTTTRSVGEIIDDLRPALSALPGPLSVTFVRRKTGPPTTTPISLKVRGNDIAEIRSAVAAVKKVLRSTPGVSDIIDDDVEGGPELLLSLDPDAITRAGIHPDQVVRSLRLFADGEKVASTQFQGEPVDVLVRAKPADLQDTQGLLAYSLSIPGAGEIALGELLHVQTGASDNNIRHHNFRRAVTVEANIDPAVTDTLRANAQVLAAWGREAARYPTVNLDFSGELDDIKEGLNSLAVLFLVGLGLIFLILATQFRSYIQPLIVLTTVPMAAVGVVIGLWLSDNPLSLFTLYGIIALAGIAANDAIVLISTINRYLLRSGLLGSAVVLAAKRRLMPILITTVTTIAGLFSLATGLGGESLMWGPVATAIVWGLGVSTLLTLTFLPLLYQTLAGALQQRSYKIGRHDLAATLSRGYLAWFWGPLFRPFLGLERIDYSDLKEMLQDPDLAAVYEQGMSGVRANDVELPIRCFEELARRRPQSVTFHILAAEANIRLMQQRGWDIGYSDRARRHLSVAKATGGENRRLALLEAALRELDKSAED